MTNLEATESLPNLGEAIERFNEWTGWISRFYRIEYSSKRGQSAWDLGEAALRIEPIEEPLTFLATAILPKIMVNEQVGTGKTCSIRATDVRQAGLMAEDWLLRLSCLRTTLDEALTELQQVRDAIQQAEKQVSNLIFAEQDARDAGYTMEGFYDD